MIDNIKNYFQENYIKITSKKISIDLDIPISKLIVLYKLDYIKIFNIDEIIINNNLNILYHSDNKLLKYACESLLKYNYIHSDVLYPYVSWFTKNELLSKSECEQSLISNFIASYNTCNYYTKLEYINKEYFLNTYCNIKIINNIIKQRCIPKIFNKIIELLQANIKEEFLNNSKQSLNIILNNTPKNQVINDLTCNSLNNNIKLFNYQINDILWMNDLVNKIENNNNVIKLDYNAYHNLIFTNQIDKTITYKFVLYNNILLYNNIDINDKASEEILYKGGNLISVMGLGKCMGKNTPILMFDGSIKMIQDIEKNELLMGDDSTPRNVLSITTGQDEMYQIIPDKGSSYIVNQHHILCLKYTSDKRLFDFKKSKQFQIKWFDNDTITSKTMNFSYKDKIKKDILKHATLFFNNITENLYINISVKNYIQLPIIIQFKLKGYKTAINFSEKYLKCDAYTFGYFLNDNYNTQYNSFLNEFKNLNIIDKHIPIIYKCNSRENRLKLLAGILDAENNFNNKTEYEIIISIKSHIIKQDLFVNDIIYLCRSLGFSCYKNEKQIANIYLGITSYDTILSIIISGNTINEIPILNSIKKINKNKNGLVSSILVKHIGKDNYYGFQLDGNHKYVLGDFTVTHNTIITLCYIFNNNYKNEFDKFIEFTNTNKCNYFYKRGKNKSSVCIKTRKINLYCNEHSNTLFIDKRITNFKNLEQFNIKKYVQNNKFMTHASLIICPNHLCNQWVREYYTKFKQDFINSKRILLLATFDQYCNLTIGEILFADIIVISYDFLLNSNYNKLINNDINIKNVLNDLIIKQTLNINQYILNKHFPSLCVLQNFKYHQIFFDECHEIMDRPKKLDDIINTFNSLYFWNITGTPFPNGLESLTFGIKKITNFSKHILSESNLFNNNNIHKLSFLYRRNTKLSIKSEYTQTSVFETIKLLDFTEQERIIYDGYFKGHSKYNNNFDFLIKLCCDTSIDKTTNDLVKNCKTLDEIQFVILNHNKKLVDESLNKISNLQLIITQLNNNLLIPTFNDLEKSHLKQQLSINKRNLTNENKTYESVFKTYSFLKNAIDTINISETCPICLDDITEVAITKCGHKFCQECITEYIVILKYNDPRCPKCNIQIKIHDFHLLQDSNPIVPLVNLSDLDNLVIKLKSTKIANIIYYLKNNLKKEDKCILFSQWDIMFNKIGDLLQTEKINVIYCTGTVYQKTRAIDNFINNKSCNIIFLSSENAASGINLTVANKIIFVEPVHGEYQYRKDIENQAIGRCIRINQTREVEIIRFIIKNTIEHDILIENDKYHHDLSQLNNQNQNQNQNNNNILNQININNINNILII